MAGRLNGGSSPVPLSDVLQASLDYIAEKRRQLEALARRERSLLTAKVRMEKFYTPEAITGCWLWHGSVDKKGYGRLNVGNAPELAHRLSWRFRHGDPGELCVLHKCDTPSCINPDHLFLGTLLDNNNDMLAKGRRRPTVYLVTCKRGHPRSGENLVTRPNGARCCRECMRLHCRERRLRTSEQERERARELYWANVEENRRKARDRQRGYRK